MGSGPSNGARGRNGLERRKPASVALGFIDRVGDNIQGACAANEPGGKGIAGVFCGSSPHRPLGSLQHLPWIAADLLGTPVKGFSGIQRTPWAIGRPDRQRTFEKSAEIIEALVQGEGRDMGPGTVATSDNAPAGRNREIPVCRVHLSARDNAAGVPDGAETRQKSLDVYACCGCRADEQCGGASGSPGGAVAPEKLWHPERAGKPVRGKNADREGYVAATKPERNGLSFDGVLIRDARTSASVSFA